MRIALIALLFTCLTLSGCGKTYKSSKYIGGTTVISGYPACVGSDISNWSNCAGRILVDTKDKVFVDDGVYVDGQPNGPFSATEIGRGETHTCSGSNRNGNRHGWVVCKSNNVIVSREFYIGGVISQEEKSKALANQYKSECEDLGFTPRTQEFGNCVLKLRELAQGSKPTTVIQSQPVQTAPTTADKIEGTRQILEAIQGVTTPAQSTGKQIDLSCVNVCQAQGKSLMYCRSDCAY